MTNNRPRWTDLFCGNCGKRIGQQDGAARAVTGLRCDDTQCILTEPASPLDDRNAVIVALVLDGVPVPRVAAHFNSSRQRIYQIVTAWKQGS